MQVGCVKLAQVHGASAQTAFDAGSTFSNYEILPGERRRTDAPGLLVTPQRRN
jgi:hypothetical protein